MPITKSAIKKQRVDKRRALINRPIKSKMKTAIKTARANPSKETLTELYSVLDIAVKKHLTKKNTAARLKSRIVKMAKEQKIDNPFKK